MTRIATVFGASGKQGSSVVRALIADDTFKPRAVTRDVNSPAARKLAEEGCEVVQADMADKESVKRAVAGAETVFCVTVPFTGVSELDQGINIIDASKKAGPDMVLPWTWIDRDMGLTVTALMKQYDTRSFEIIGQTFVLGYAFSTEFEWYPGTELPDPRLGKLGVEVGSIGEFAPTTWKAHVEV
ncbi:NmrA-like family-domain-containing protein [Schizophyllum commune]